MRPSVIDCSFMKILFFFWNPYDDKTAHFEFFFMGDGSGREVSFDDFITRKRNGEHYT